LFINSSKSEYIWIFAKNLILISAYLFLIKKVYLDIVYASQNIQCKILFRGNICECLKKISSISDEPIAKLITMLFIEQPLVFHWSAKYLPCDISMNPGTHCTLSQCHELLLVVPRIGSLTTDSTWDNSIRCALLWGGGGPGQHSSAPRLLYKSPAAGPHQQSSLNHRHSACPPFPPAPPAQVEEQGWTYRDFVHLGPLPSFRTRSLRQRPSSPRQSFLQSTPNFGKAIAAWNSEERTARSRQIEARRG
jgi:hypothetical protein